MTGFNWLDIVLILMLLVGMALGYSQGLVRQLIGLLAIYVGLVLAVQFFQPLSRFFADLVNEPPNTMTNVLFFFVIFFVTLTLVNVIALDAYKSTRIRIVPFFDHITGMLLGVVSMWIIITIAVNVLFFASNTGTWGGQYEAYRNVLENGLEASRISQVTASTLPMIVATIRFWLPSGSPALFDI